MYKDTVQLPMGGDFPEKSLKRPLSEINEFPINLMQADNTGERGTQNSSEATSTSHVGGVSSRGFSLGSLEKLLEERNKLIKDTRKFLQENANSAQPNANSAQPAESSPNIPVTGDLNDLGYHLIETRYKNYEAIVEFVKCHHTILGRSFIAKEISPFVDQIEDAKVDFLDSMHKIEPDHST